MHELSADHLAPERLAAVADEPPSSAEAHHLSSCPECAAEVQAFQSLLAITRSERDRLGEPLTTWDTLAAALAREDSRIGKAANGLAYTARARPRTRRIAGRAAAGVVLMAAGVAAGRLSATMNTKGTLEGASIVGRRGGSIATPIELTSDTFRFTARSQALDALNKAESEYRHAVAYLMTQQARTEDPTGFETRVEALSDVEQTMRAALRKAPADPVLNLWLISTVGARNATQHQLEAYPVTNVRQRY